MAPPEPGNSYCHVGENLPLCDLVLQVEFLREDDTVTFICSTLAGKELLCFNACGFDLASDIHNDIARRLNASSLQVLLPDGQLLGSICRAHPLVTVADVEHKNWWLSPCLGQLLHLIVLYKRYTSTNWSIL